MNEIFVMRRANGDVFTEEINGKLGIPVWSNEEAVMRYKERNPELGVFLPQRLTHSMLKNLTGEAESAPGFFLLSEDDPDAQLDDGRAVSLEEIIQSGERVPPSAQATA